VREIKPNISIVTINLNNRVGLEKTIESVVNQGYNNLEYIVIDGGSTDGSIEVIKQHENKIGFWLSEKDSGIYNAMNKGIKAATGEYLVFLNSGDTLCKNEAIENVLKLVDAEADVCSCDIYHYDGRSLNLHPSPRNASFHYLFHYSLPHPSTLIRKALFEEFGLYNEANRIVSDWEFFFFTLIIKNRKYQKINYPLSVFDLSGISNNKSMEDLINRERKQVLDRYIPKAVQDESIKLWEEQNQYRMLQKRITNRRYQLLEQIEKNLFLARILTFMMIVISKLARLLQKISLR
jgi:glycosyltransferase involved in cell wall biosynthesis